MKQKLGVIYARQSSGDSEDKSESIAVQLERCRAEAKNRNIKVVFEAKDADISGRTYPSGKDAVEFCKHDSITMEYISKIKSEGKRYRDGLAKVLSHFGQIDYVITYDERRVARALANSFLDSYLSQQFVKSNVELITLQSGIINYGRDNDKLVSLMQSHVQDSAVKLAAQKSKEGMAKAHKEGMLLGGRLTGYSPAGHQKVEKNNDALIIEEIFKKFNAGSTIADIIRWAEKNDPKKRKWFHSGIHRILKCRMYTGYRLKDHRELDDHKELDEELIEIKPLIGKMIVSKKDFAKAQARLQRNPGAGVGRSNDSKVIHPLSGLLACGNCGKNLQTRGENYGSFYYRCRYNYPASRSGGISCGNSHMLESNHAGKCDCGDFHTLPLKECLKPFLFKALLIQRAETSGKDETAVQKELLQNKLNDIAKKEAEFLDMFSEGTLSREQFAKGMKKQETRKVSTHKEIIALNTKVNAALDKNRFQEYFDMMDALHFSKGKLKRYTKDGKLIPAMEFTDTIYRELALRSFKKIHAYKYHVHIVFRDDTAVTLERIAFGNSRNLPEIEIKLDTSVKPYKYDFYVLNKSFLQARKADYTLQVQEYKTKDIIYNNGDMRIIKVGENDTTAMRYEGENLTYMKNLPKE